MSSHASPTSVNFWKNADAVLPNVDASSLTPRGTGQIFHGQSLTGQTLPGQTGQTATLLASASSSFASSAGVTPIAPASTPLVGSFAEPPTPLSAGPTPLSGPTPLASSGLTPQASWGAASTPRAPVPTPVATPGSYTRLGASLIQTNLRGSDADKADAPPLTKLTRDRSKPADRSEPSDRSESGDRSDSDGGSDSDDNRLVMTEVPSLPRKANHASVGHSAGRFAPGSGVPLGSATLSLAPTRVIKTASGGIVLQSINSKPQSINSKPQPVNSKP